MEGQSDITTQPHVVSTRASSASLRRSSEELGDHADTPMRKRPRLDSGAAADEKPALSEALQRVSEDTVVDETLLGRCPARPTDDPALLRTSRVTLTHRTPDTSPQLEGQSLRSVPLDTAESSDARQFDPLRSPGPLIVHQITPSSGSSETVDIEVDGPTDIYPDRQHELGAVAEDLETALDRALQALGDFPPETYSATPLEKATWFYGQLSKENLHLDMGPFQAISIWLRDCWLPQLSLSSSSAHVVYSQHRDLWVTLANIYIRFLSRKTLPSNFTPRSIASSHVKKLQELLAPSLALCASLVSADVEQMQNAVKSNLEIDLLSTRHLRYLHLLFWPPSSVSLWRMIQEGFHLDAQEIQRELATQIFLDDPHAFDSFIRFAQLIMTDTVTIAKYSMELDVILGHLQFAHRHLKNSFHCQQPMDDMQRVMPGLARLHESLLQIAKSLEQMLLQGSKRQESFLPNDMMVRMADCCSSIVSDVACINRSSVTSFFRPDFDLGDDDVSDATVQQVQTCTILRLAWQFLTRGRMELRVQSLDLMSNGLVAYWKHANISTWQDEDARRVYFTPVASWMRKSKVVEYICGVESHPQLISRSCNVLGFLFVTHFWEPYLTDTVWTAIQQTPDPRICAALWDVLGQSTGHMAPIILVSFCQKLAHLPAANFNEETTEFINKLANAIEPLFEPNRNIHWRLDADMIREVLGAYTRLVRETAEGSGQTIDERVRQKVHQIALSWVERFLRQIRDPHWTHFMYETCLEYIHVHSQGSLGSLEIIIGLASLRPEDLIFLLSKKSLSELVAEELCVFVDDIKNRHMSADLPPGLESRLAIFSSLVCHPAGAEFSKDLQQRLWTHLVGDEACNDAARDAAWSPLSKIVHNAMPRSALVEEWIQVLLPGLAPIHFRPGTLQFLIQAMAYVRRSTNPHNLFEDQAIEVPLADTWWRIILMAPENTVESSAIEILSHSHVEEAFVQDASISSITATHTALVEQCISQLEAVARTRLPQGGTHDDQYDAESDLSDGTTRPQTKFQRTLQFLMRFILDVRGQPRFRSASSVASSPSMSPSTGQASRNLVEIPYQVFGPGYQDSNIRRLHISSSATFADLRASLERRTKFTSMSLIHGGAFLDVANKLNQFIEPIVGKGLIMVLNKDRNAVIHAFSKGPGLSAAERAVLDHFNTLYGFLDLQQALSNPVSIFLLLLPPNNRIRETVIQEDVSFGTLFPPHNPAKRHYSLYTLKAELSQQQNSGSIDEVFLVRAIHLLVEGLTSTLGTSPEPSADTLRFAQGLIDCLLMFLKERPIEERVTDHFPNGQIFAESMYGLLLQQSLGHIRIIDGHVDIAYACLMEASLHSTEVWNTLQSLDGIEGFHRWLLVQSEPYPHRLRTKHIIENLCTSASSPVGISSLELCQFYWRTLSPSIGTLSSDPLRAKEFLEIVSLILSQQARALTDEAGLRELLSSWASLLSKYEHVELPGLLQTDMFAQGLVNLLSLCVSSLKSFKKPVNGRDLLELLFSRFLFPPTAHAKNTPGAFLSPILDNSTRKQTYYVITSLCEDSASFQWIVDQLSLLTSFEGETFEISWNADRSKWLRAPIGRSGLRNLTNTCYMNSLVAQLFMNDGFRHFMMEVEPLRGQTTNLLAETQSLFAHMQGSNSKYADTWDFAYAIKPYDAEHIDVTVQMDVDEFYNLLFDRWEAQMPSLEAKQTFRSFYGGQSVMQIKSKDCEHVSERVEPFFTIQCEVKGKADLRESLKAYIEGDVMEGDNKYKCESCGGKFVDAVKRTCLKDIPDNLIFHLKRFDFDLTTFMRNKINDEFSFPETIDMRPFSIDCIDNTAPGGSSDMFELVGVLVHAGTAETGHYYSYIRLPDDIDSAHGRWAEFNDTEVSEFEKSKIPDTCFGGRQMMNGEASWLKPWNAYMLFYRRVSVIPAKKARLLYHDRDEPVKTRDYGVTAETSNEIVAANQRTLRRYCLFDPSHASFVQNILTDLMLRQSSICSEDHSTQRRVLNMALHHASAVFSHMKSTVAFEGTLQQIFKICSKCSHCSSLALHWVADNPFMSECMLILSPIPLVRLAWSDFIASVLTGQRNLDIGAYGFTFDTEESDDFSALVPLDDRSSLFRIVELLHQILPNIGRGIRAWDEFFGLLHSIASLGVQEIAILLNWNILADVLEVLKLDRTRNPPRNIRYREIHEQLSRTKRTPPVLGLARLLHKLLVHVDPCRERSPSRQARLRDYNARDRRFPLLSNEMALVREKMARTDHLTMLIKLVELWVEQEMRSESHLPSDVVQTLLACAIGDDIDAVRTGHNDTDEDFERLIRDTLKACVQEYELAWIGTALEMSLVFLRNCSSQAMGVPLVDAVATAAEGLLKSATPRSTGANYIADYENQGGCKVLDFLQKLAFVVNPVCSVQDDGDRNTFLQAIIKAAPIWAPGMLIFEPSEVRQGTAVLLEQLIFETYPEHLSIADTSSDTGDDELSQLDTTRIEAVRSLYQRCAEAVSHANELRLPVRFVHEISSIVAQCASWCNKLRYEDSEPLVSATTEQDHRTLHQFQHLHGVLSDWSFETDPDESITDTEWASDLEDSDEIAGT